jgi:hypothetical protein
VPQYMPLMLCHRIGCQLPLPLSLSMILLTQL